MSTSVTCPECDARLTLRTVPAQGASLKCPKCTARFVYSETGDAKTAVSKKSAIRAEAPPRRRRDPDEDVERPRRQSARSDEPDEDEERRPRKKKKAAAGSNTGLLIGLGVGAGGLVALIVAVAIVIFAMRAPAVVPQQAKGVPPKQMVNVPPQPVPPQPAKKENKDDKRNDPVPVAPLIGQPAVPPKELEHPPPRPKELKPAELYGDQGGEQVGAADAGIPGSVMRARRDDTFFKLSNPREGEVKGPDAKGKGNSVVHQALLIDYVVVRRGKLDGGTLVIHTDDGGRAEVALNFLVGRDQGTIELVGVNRSGFFKGGGVNTKTAFPKNAEFYVTRGDPRYVPPAKFMVSNSLVMGTMKVTSLARDWTTEELRIYGKPPPAYKSPNLHPTYGEDVPPHNGWPWKNRYVEPEGRLLGLEYHMSAWANQPRIGSLVPIFSQDQSQPGALRDLARPGYAVAGAEVNFDKDNVVFGIRLLYRRVKDDNTLDAADAYSGEWIGTPAAGAPRVLGNDGRRVMGMSTQNGAVVDRFSLVIAR